MIIFENQNLSLLRVCNQVLQDMGEFIKVQSVQSQRLVHPPLLEGNLVIGVFDGALQNGGEKCGAGALLKCQVQDVYSIKLNCGTGTNTRGELLALLSLLFFFSS